MSPLVEARGLEIGGRLEKSAISLQAGTLMCLVGPNGSGKTSLLHALAGIPPSSSAVRIAGENPHVLPPALRQRLFTLLPASREILWPLRARDLIALSLPPGTDWRPVAEDLELGPLLDRRVDSLSTGERTRVLIARALAPDPRLLLLDEPVANLDPYWQLLVLERLKKAATEEGKAVLIAIHDLAAARRFADRMVLMSAGRLVADGTSEEILCDPLAEQVFGVAWTGSGWELRPPEGLRSSP